MTTDLWSERRGEARKRVEPLPVRMRPRSLDEVAGQRHLLAPGKLLRRMVEADAITSMIFHGPPGTGKTTLAEVIGGLTRRVVIRENAAVIGVKRIREIVEAADARVVQSQTRTILFLDEIHRFTKSQQDVLLGDVERGVITLIGATTENPQFACNAALVSRSTLFRLESLEPDDIAAVIRRAASDADRGYGRLDLTLTDEAVRVWAIKSDGDARRALTALEVAVLSSDASGPITIDRAVAEDSIQEKAAVYDGTGDEHYDVISAMIKSVRGGDPDAAIYWIARMLDAGEDPRYIARRLAILASEDIGNADPRAIVIADSCWSLVERIGMPEARITLAQCAIYLALAPKSNASYLAIDEALTDVRTGRTVPVPVYLRDPNSSPLDGGDGASVNLRKRDGEKYQYSHNDPDRVTGQDYLGVEKWYYRPTQEGSERLLSERLEYIRRLRSQKES